MACARVEIFLLKGFVALPYVGTFLMLVFQSEAAAFTAVCSWLILGNWVAWDSWVRPVPEAGGEKVGVSVLHKPLTPKNGADAAVAFLVFVFLGADMVALCASFEEKSAMEILARAILCALSASSVGLFVLEARAGRAAKNRGDGEGDEA